MLKLIDKKNDRTIFIEYEKHVFLKLKNFPKLVNVSFAVIYNGNNLKSDLRDYFPPLGKLR